MYQIYTTIAPVLPEKIFIQVETDLTNYNEGSCVPNWLIVKPRIWSEPIRVPDLWLTNCVHLLISQIMVWANESAPLF